MFLLGALATQDGAAAETASTPARADTAGWTLHCSHQVQTIQIPGSGQNLAVITVSGAQGGHATGGDSGGAGFGGQVKASVPVQGGTALIVWVGCQGHGGQAFGNGQGGAGGNAPALDSSDGGGGGGASAVTGGNGSLLFRLVGGGGGGAGGQSDAVNDEGGTGGYGGRTPAAGHSGGNGATNGGCGGCENSPNGGAGESAHGANTAGGGGGGGGGCRGGHGGQQQEGAGGGGGGGGTSCVSGPVTSVRYADNHEHGNGLVSISVAVPVTRQ